MSKQDTVVPGLRVHLHQWRCVNLDRSNLFYNKDSTCFGGVLKGIQDANGVLPGLFGIIVAANGLGSVLS